VSKLKNHQRADFLRAKAFVSGMTCKCTRNWNILIVNFTDHSDSKQPRTNLSAQLRSQSVPRYFTIQANLRNRTGSPSVHTAQRT